MKTNFFITNCKEPERTDVLFGICDDENEDKAYTDIENEDKWIAIVKNEMQEPVSFTAIDNCLDVLKEGTNDQESTCDGMLTFNQYLYLVELKNQNTSGWKPRAFEQLENTIQLIKQDPNFDRFKYKKAFACNKKKKRPRFKTSDNERNRRFFAKYGFRIGIQSTIVIK